MELQVPYASTGKPSSPKDTGQADADFRHALLNEIQGNHSPPPLDPWLCSRRAAGQAARYTPNTMTRLLHLGIFSDVN